MRRNPRTILTTAMAASAVFGATLIATTWVLPGPAGAVSTGASTLTIVADSWTNPAKPKSSYGSSTSLQVGVSGTSRKDLYFSVDPSALPQAVRETRLSLQLTPAIKTPKGTGSLVLYRLDSAPTWSENGVTYASRVPCDAANGVQLSSPVPVPASSTAPVTITSSSTIAQALPTRSGTTLCVTMAGTASTPTYTFRSKEAPTERPVVTATWLADADPVAEDDVAVVASGEAAVIDVLANDSDPDGDPLAVDSVVQQPEHGQVVVVATAAGVAKAVQYTPEAAFCGTDRLRYRVTDTPGVVAPDRSYGYDEADVTITVACGNAPPETVDDHAEFMQDSGAVLDPLTNDHDPEGTDLVLVAAGPAAHGTTTVTDGDTVRYRPDPGYLGDDQFTYTVADALGLEATATVTVRRGCELSQTLVPSCGVWWGSAQIPGGVASLEGLETRLGAPLPIGHLYHRNGEVFPTPEETAYATRTANPTVMFFNVKPEWLASGTLTWAQVVDGQADAYIGSIADAMAATDHPMLVTLHHEPEDAVDETPGSGMTADDYAAMYRYVVDRIESRAPDANVTWVWNVTGFPRWEGMWPSLYPGDDFVDWIGYAPFLQNPAGCDISCIVNRTYADYPAWDGFYDWAQSAQPDKPLMLAEWGVTESSTPGQELAKAALFESAPEVLAQQFPNLRALIYFNDAKDPSDPTSVRVETSTASLDAFRAMTSDPYFSSARRSVPAP